MKLLCRFLELDHIHWCASAAEVNAKQLEDKKAGAKLAQLAQQHPLVTSVGYIRLRSIILLPHIRIPSQTCSGGESSVAALGRGGGTGGGSRRAVAGRPGGGETS
jgi:hypothetical protein